MISGLRQNNSNVAFKRDISHQECDALQNRNFEALFDIGYKIGTREIRISDGALDTLDMRSFTPFYHRSRDAAFTRPIAEEHMSESFYQVVKTLLRTPPPEKNSIPADVSLIRGFAAGHPKNVAQSGFCLGCGAFDPKQVVSSIKEFRQGGLMLFNGTVDAFRVLEQRSRELAGPEPSKLHILVKGLLRQNH